MMLLLSSHFLFSASFLPHRIPSEGSLIPRQLKQGRLCLQRNHSLSGFITVAPCDKIRHQASNQVSYYSMIHHSL